MSDPTLRSGARQSIPPDPILAEANRDEMSLFDPESPADSAAANAKPIPRPPITPVPVKKKGQHAILQRTPFKTTLHMVGLLLIMFSITMLPPR